MLIFFLSILGFIVAFSILPPLLNGGTRQFSKVLGDFALLTLIVTAITFSVRVHAMIHESSIQPYVTTPATVEEKFVHLLLLGLTYLVLSLIVLQICYTIEVLLYPDIIENYQLHRYSLYREYANGYVLNPLSFFPKTLGVVAYVVSLLLYISVTFRRKYVAYPLYFLAPLATIISLGWLLNEWFVSIGQLVNDRDITVTLEQILLVVGVVLLFLAYLSLRKVQLKQ